MQKSFPEKYARRDLPRGQIDSHPIVALGRRKPQKMGCGGFVYIRASFAMMQHIYRYKQVYGFIFTEMTRSLGVEKRNLESLGGGSIPAPPKEHTYFLCVCQRSRGLILYTAHVLRTYMQRRVIVGARLDY